MLVAALHSSFLCLLPVLALAVPLLMRRYPGERLILGLRSERRAPRSKRAPSVRMPPRPAAAHVRGSMLLGRSLAERPPPACIRPA